MGRNSHNLSGGTLILANYVAEAEATEDLTSRSGLRPRELDIMIVKEWSARLDIPLCLLQAVGRQKTLQRQTRLLQTTWGWYSTGRPTALATAAG